MNSYQIGIIALGISNLVFMISLSIILQKMRGVQLREKVLQEQLALERKRQSNRQGQ